MTLRLNRPAGLMAALVMMAGLAEGTMAKSRYSMKNDAPPFNVAARDIPKLLGGRIYVGAPRWGGIEYRVFGRDGKITYCVTPSKGKPFWRQFRWWADAVTRDGRTGHGYFVARKHKSKKSYFRLLQHFPKTGKLDVYGPDAPSQMVERIARGHIQKRLPASVYKLCPGFPSASSLGVGINKRQTSTSYRRLVAQDAGQRIKRPDLVTPGLRQLALPKHRRKK